MTSAAAALRLAFAIAFAMVVGCAHAQRDAAYQDAAKLYREGEYARALERINGVIDASPKDARARFLKGLILAGQKKTQEAVSVLTALTQDYPELPEPYNNLGVLYAAQGDYEKARTALEMAILAHPGYATAHENLGDVYANMAAQSYAKASQLDRANTTAQAKLRMIRELFSATGGTGGKPAVLGEPGNTPGGQKAAKTSSEPRASPSSAQPARSTP